jgi:steroid 5-alpha reductase family enzyme
LGPYLIPAYRLASRQASNDVSIERFWVCAYLYTVGIVVMLLSDSQKFYTLKYKKGLISDGMMKYTRNPNYLGEMALYGSFIILANDTISYIAVMQVWFIAFPLRMYLKEVSLRKKAGWEEYAARSWVVIPKINGRTLDSIVFYSLCAFLINFTYQNGGILVTLEQLRGAFVKA